MLFNIKFQTILWGEGPKICFLLLPDFEQNIGLIKAHPTLPWTQCAAVKKWRSEIRVAPH